ncbi:MAG: hypothetical protein IPG97_00385 [Microthrixaceae bacterium]|nr:hypothetical protein [Microthrixaceae bacterium]
MDGDDHAGLNVYAHCTPGSDAASVTCAVVNPSPTDARTVTTRSPQATVYHLTAEDLDSTQISLNGKDLVAADDGTLPDLVGEKIEGSSRWRRPGDLRGRTDRQQGLRLTDTVLSGSHRGEIRSMCPG